MDFKMKKILALLVFIFNFNVAAALDHPLTIGYLSEVCAQKSPKNRRICHQSVLILKNFNQNLSAKTNIPLDFKLYNRVESFVDLFEKGKVDGGFVKLAPFLKLKKKMGNRIQPIAISTDNTGASIYYSALITLRGNQIKQWSDLKGKTIGLIRDSISGFYFPKAFLRSKHLSKEVATVVYDNYYDAASGLQNGEVFGLFAASNAFAGGDLGKPETMQFKLIDQELPMALFVINTDRVGNREIATLKKGLSKTSTSFHGQGINTFAGFKPLTKEKCTLIEELISILN